MGGFLIVLGILCMLASPAMLAIFIVRWCKRRSKKWFGISAGICAGAMWVFIISGALLLPETEEPSEPGIQSADVTSALESVSQTTDISSQLSSSLSEKDETTVKPETSSPQTTQARSSASETASTSQAETTDSLSETDNSPEQTSAKTSAIVTSSSPKSTEPSSSAPIASGGEIVNVSAIPEFSGSPYVVLNGNIPVFSDAELTEKSYEYYTELDYLGRCGAAVSCVGVDIMPTEERGSIGQIKPTGWHTVKYDIVDGKYLYNRCHLIGFQLSGENANVCNLITGTRYMNVDGMLPFENMVADYVKETKNHVLYRVTPVFVGTELVARGVAIEAFSVEDGGDGICFNVFVFNVQPGIEIDYQSGESKLASTAETSATTKASTKSTTSEPKTNPPVTEKSESATTPNTTVRTTTVGKTTQASPSEETTTSGETTKETSSAEPPAITEEEEQTYVLNTNSKKFHYPFCSSVDKMKDANKKIITASRDEIISMGYESCGRCNP